MRRLRELDRLAARPQGSGSPEDFDRLGILRGVLTGEAGGGWKAHEVFLAWLLSLPAEIDPSVAAGAVLARFEAALRPLAEPREERTLMGLLEETMSWPRPVLETLTPRRRWRNGT